MREVTIKLGGKEYVVTQLTIRNEATWRGRAQQALAPLWDAAGLLETDITQPGDIVAMIGKVSDLLDPLPALDVVCAYSPALQADREWIEENAYSDEVFGVLVTLFFGQLRQLERLPGALNGAMQKAT